MATTHEVRGIGHSVKRKEDERFIRGKGQYFEDIVLPGMLHMEILRSPVAHARINSIDVSAAEALPGVVAVVTGELMAQHNLAWMPTLSGDTQAVLATDKVRYQGQEVACVVAESAYVAKDALELIEVDYERAAGGDEPAGGRGGERAADPGREGGPDLEPRLPLGGRRQGGDRPGLRGGRPRDALDTFYPRCHPAPLECCGCMADVDPGTGKATIYMTSQAPHALRTLFAIVAGLPEHLIRDHQPRSRRRLRQQGADLPGLRRRHRGVAAPRPPGQVGRGPARET